MADELRQLAGIFFRLFEIVKGGIGGNFHPTLFQSTETGTTFLRDVGKVSGDRENFETRFLRGDSHEDCGEGCERNPLTSG